MATIGVKTAKTQPVLEFLMQVYAVSPVVTTTFPSYTDIKKPKVRHSPLSGKGTFPEKTGMDAGCSPPAHAVLGGVPTTGRNVSRS